MWAEPHTKENFINHWSEEFRLLHKCTTVHQVSHDNIAGSGWKLIKVAFFSSRLLTRYLFFNGITGSSQVITLREKERVHATAEFLPKFTPGPSLTSLLTYSLHNHLLESNFCNLGKIWYAYWVRFVKIESGKKYKTTRWTIHAHNLSFFEFLI